MLQVAMPWAYQHQNSESELVNPLHVLGAIHEADESVNSNSHVWVYCEILDRTLFPRRPAWFGMLWSSVVSFARKTKVTSWHPALFTDTAAGGCRRMQRFRRPRRFWRWPPGSPRIRGLEVEGKASIPLVSSRSKSEPTKLGPWGPGALGPLLLTLL